MTFELEQSIGPYRIVSQLGRGGMATVYKVYQASLDRFVAMKILRPDLQSNPDFIARFKREAKTIAKLDHPNIIPVYDIEVYEGAVCLIMRYVEGLSLREALNRLKKPLAMPAIMHIMRPVTDALAYAHHKSILHRDVKPANVMLGSDGNVYLMDFGLAVTATESELNASKGFVLGTPYYISPEQAKGEPLDQRTDIYSLGVVLYELLTAQVPFTGESYDVVVYHQIFTLPSLPSKINPQVSPDVEHVVFKCLAKDKSDRYYNISDMMQALQDADQVAFKPPRPTSPPETKQSPSITPEEQLNLTSVMGKRVRGRWSASGSLLVLALVILAFEILFFFPTFRTELRNILVTLGSSVDQRADAVRIIIGTISAYIATLSAHIILSNLRKRLPGVAFFFAVAFGVTLLVALALAFLVLLLLNIL